jgi:hypothetical protein
MFDIDELSRVDESAEEVAPTGTCHQSTAPPLPGYPVIEVSEVEAAIGVALITLHAA